MSSLINLNSCAIETEKVSESKDEVTEETERVKESTKDIEEVEETVTSETEESKEDESEEETEKEAEEEESEEEEATEEEIIEEPGYEEATCTRVIDGDTIEIRDNAGNTFKIRYIGIDTPEEGTPYYTEATEANRYIVEGKTLRLVKDVSETDRYGRLLRYVYVGELFINAHLVAEGFAQIMTIPPDVAYSEYFLDLQQQARNSNKGLWGLVAEEEETQTQEQEQQDESQTGYTGKFVGSKNSDVYHYPDCASAKRIKEENKIWFNSVEEAKAAGYRPCKRCNPPG